jgi:hypothetical protein
MDFFAFAPPFEEHATLGLPAPCHSPLHPASQLNFTASSRSNDQLPWLHVPCDMQGEHSLVQVKLRRPPAGTTDDVSHACACSLRHGSTTLFPTTTTGSPALIDAMLAERARRPRGHRRRSRRLVTQAR